MVSDVVMGIYPTREQIQGLFQFNLPPFKTKKQFLNKHIGTMEFYDAFNSKIFLL